MLSLFPQTFLKSRLIVFLVFHEKESVEWNLLQKDLGTL